MFYGSAFVVLVIIALLMVFPSDPLGHLIGVMIYTFVGTILVLFGAILLFIGVRIYKKRRPETTEAPKEGKAGGAQSTPAFLFPLILGSIWVGIPVAIGLGLITYTIAPGLLTQPNMVMLAVVITALYYALRSAVTRSRMTSPSKKEAHQTLHGMRSRLGWLTLIMWLILPGYYAYYTPGTFTQLLETSKLSGPERSFLEYQKKKERLGQSVSEDELPQNTLLDPGISTSETSKWVAVFNILNPHIGNEGIARGIISPALLDAAKGNPLRLDPGSRINTEVLLSVTNGTGVDSDGILLYNGDCRSPTMDRGGSGHYTLKTCSGNWRTQSGSMMGVYGIVFNNTGRIVSVDLYEGSHIKGLPDMKLIIHKED